MAIRSRPDPPERLDLTAFTTRDECLWLARGDCPEIYTNLAKRHLTGAQDLTQDRMVFMAAVSRARGLHEGIMRELHADNPHSALPLIRAFAELVTIVMYTTKNPAYLATLRGDNFKRKSFGAMFDALRGEASGLKVVYEELSEYSHFGPLAIFNAHRITDEVAHTTAWTDAPNWRDEKHFKIACAQCRELAIAARHWIDALGSVVALNARTDPDTVIGRIADPCAP